MAGLDEITCEGIKRFSTLQKFVNTMSINSDTKKNLEIQLEIGKRYLKTSYGLHCSIKSTIASHCISCAMCHTDNEDFKTLHLRIKTRL